MKPTKNKVFCNNCGRTKMLFETEKKAENFIKFSKDEIEAKSGYSPNRSYYCLFCGGWHLTSIKEKIGISNNEKLFEEYVQEKSNSNCQKIIIGFENQIKGMDTSQKEKFFLEKITLISKEIELYKINDDNINKGKLKESCKKLESLYILRKQNGFHKEKPKTKIEELRDKQLEEYKNWVEKKQFNNC